MALRAKAKRVCQARAPRDTGSNRNEASACSSLDAVEVLVEYGSRKKKLRLSLSCTPRSGGSRSSGLRTVLQTVGAAYKLDHPFTLEVYPVLLIVSPVCSLDGGSLVWFVSSF